MAEPTLHEQIKAFLELRDESVTPEEADDAERSASASAILDIIEGDLSRCIACDVVMKEGDLYFPDASGGEIHAACVGPERECYTLGDEPLPDGEPIPEPRVWSDLRSNSASQAGEALDLPVSSEGGRRRGDWMQTFTGRQFWPMDPLASEVEIADIAHALSMQCRFGGHCLRFYSVAEHSVLLARAVAPEHALWALLHDASEAYLVDVPRPVKPFLDGYKEAESIVMAAICDRFGLTGPMPWSVKVSDGQILADEAAQNMAAPPVAWNDTGPPLGVELQFWTPTEAKAAFLAEFDRLTARAAISQATRSEPST